MFVNQVHNSFFSPVLACPLKGRLCYQGKKIKYLQEQNSDEQ